jgi:hypothetical protein
MKRFTLVVVLLGFFSVFSLITRPGLTGQQSEKKTDEATKLEQLQKERIDTLEELVKILMGQYQIGTIDFSTFSMAQEDLLVAKLETTEKPSERIALLEQQLKDAQVFFDFMERRYKAGVTPKVDYHRAKVLCLTIEIKLVKERDKAKASE